MRRNAYFNLVKLGATAVAFHRDFYGSMQDTVNAGDLSDRILIEWNLDAPRAARRVFCAPAGRPAVARRSRRCCPTRVGADGGPEVGSERGAVELVQIPEDIVAVRAADPALARRWRLALRETLGTALEQGYHADGLTRDGWYVVRQLPGQERTTGFDSNLQCLDELRWRHGTT